MDTVPKETFQSIYAGQAPWDIGRPQPAFLAVADQITGPVLDAGCGTGDHVAGILFLQEQGTLTDGEVRFDADARCLLFRNHSLIQPVQGCLGFPG
jgi:hypothetical protein